MTALLIIDVQNDFCPGGALAVAEGDCVVPVANGLMPAFDLVVATRDWHPANHGSFAANHPGKRPGEVVSLAGRDQILWPVHCVQHTPGAEFHPGLDTTRINAVFFKGTNPEVDSYSAFFDNARAGDTGLHAYLQAQEVDGVTLVGLATDYCVCFSALDAVELGYDTRVLLAGCRGVDLRPGDVTRAIDAMRAAGVRVE